METRAMDGRAMDARAVGDKEAVSKFNKPACSAMECKSTENNLLCIVVLRWPPV